MKTIEVTDEMYAELMAISKKMVNQDSRGTAMPYMFQVAIDEEIASFEGSGCGKELWSDTECNFYPEEDEEAIIECISEYLQDDEISEEEAINKANEIWNSGEWESFLKDHGFENYLVEDKEIYINGFFTRDAAIRYIEINKNRLRNPRPYVSHYEDNPEMETVSKFLCELSGGKIHR